MGARTFVNRRLSFSSARNLARGVDMPLVLTVIALLVFGLIMLYSASFDFSFNEYGSSSYMFIRQLRWLGLGMVIAFIVSLFDYHHWRRLVVFTMLGTIGFIGSLVSFIGLVVARPAELHPGASSAASGLSRWRCKLFAAMSRNAQPATAFFQLPLTTIIGMVLVLASDRICSHI